MPPRSELPGAAPPAWPLAAPAESLATPAWPLVASACPFAPACAVARSLWYVPAWCSAATVVVAGGAALVGRIASTAGAVGMRLLGAVTAGLGGGLVLAFRNCGPGHVVIEHAGEAR